MRVALPILLLPVLALTLVGCRRSPSERRSWGDDWPLVFHMGDSHREHWVAGDTTYTFRLEGEATLNDADTAIASLSPGGRLRITRSAREGARTLEVRNEGSGLIATLDGKPSDTPEAKAWMAEVLPEVARHTGLSAPSRARRILAQGGSEALAAEIPRLDGSHVKTHYFRAWLEQKREDPKALQALVTLAADQVESDHELSSLLKDVLHVIQAGPELQVAVAPAGPELRIAVAQAAAKVASDHDRRQTLEAVTHAGPLTPAVAQAVLASGAGIDSDHDASELLLRLVQAGNTTPAILQGVIQATNQVGSDHDAGRVLRQVAASPALDAAGLDRMIARVKGLGSDHEKAECLLAVIQSGRLDAAGRNVVAQV